MSYWASDNSQNSPLWTDLNYLEKKISLRAAAGICALTPPFGFYPPLVLDHFWPDGAGLVFTPPPLVLDHSQNKGGVKPRTLLINAFTPKVSLSRGRCFRSVFSISR